MIVTSIDDSQLKMLRRSQVKLSLGRKVEYNNIVSRE